ncbi:vacuolar protein, partial [Perkinsus olseni]
MSTNGGGKMAPVRRSSLQNFIAKIEHDLWNGEMTIANAKLNAAALSKYLRSANLTE